MKGLIRIEKDGDIYAIVLRRDFSAPGPSFFTPGEFSQQLGMLIHPKGKIVKRHRHKLVKREIFRTQEVLVLLEGRIRVELFDDDGGAAPERPHETGRRHPPRPRRPQGQGPRRRQDHRGQAGPLRGFRRQGILLRRGQP